MAVCLGSLRKKARARDRLDLNRRCQLGLRQKVGPPRIPMAQVEGRLSVETGATSRSETNFGYLEPYICSLAKKKHQAYDHQS